MKAMSWQRGGGRFLKRYDPLQLSFAEIVVILLIAIVLAEAFFVASANWFPEMSLGRAALVHGVTTLLFLGPTYLLLYRPFVQERRRADEQIRHLSRRLLSMAEEERKRLSRDLHDECGQTITALQLALETLRRRMQNPEPGTTAELADMEQLLSRLGQQIRSVSDTLRPEILDEMGLVSALRWEVREFRRRFPGIRVEERYFRLSDLPGPIDKRVEIALFRICQEGMTNVAKHSGAGTFILKLTVRRNRLNLLLQDDGRGLDLHHPENNPSLAQGIGLVGMRERVADIGGSFHLASRPGKGTLLRVSVPFRGEEI